MTIAVILGASDVRLWGLTSQERLSRQMAEVGVTDAPDRPPADATEPILMVRQDYLYEPRTLSSLIETLQPGSARGRPSPPAPDDETNITSAKERPAPAGVVLMDGETPAAAIVAASDALAATALLSNASGHGADGFPRIRAQDLGAFEGKLRKAAAPLLEPITTESAPALEDRLYGASYKGVTDFVTKWWWPVPAKAAVRFCANKRISPNSVTIAGFLLMLAACWLFFAGSYGLGLALAWMMTFLDTVDGKLARVTVQSSQFGHALDHAWTSCIRLSGTGFGACLCCPWSLFSALISQP